MINIKGDLDARILAEADARGAEDKALSDRFVSKKDFGGEKLGYVFVSKSIKTNKNMFYLMLNICP